MVVQLNSTFSGTLPPGAHVGVTCDGCRGPICGVRHKCSFCPDYDLCTQCKQNGIHNHHMMHEIQHNPHSNTSTQYPAYPQAPTQYPAYPNNPTQYPAYPQTPNQYPVYPQTPTQYPSYPQTSTQYPAQPQTPNQYPSYPQTPTQYPAQPQANTQYPAYPQTPTQYNGYPPNTGQYPQSNNPNQYPQPSQSSQPSQTGPHAVQTVSQPIQSSHSAQSFTQCHVTHSSRPHHHGSHHGPHHGRHHRHHGGNVIHGNVFHPQPRPPFHPGHTISGSQFPPVNTSQVQTLMQQMTLSNGAPPPPTQPPSFNSSSSSGHFLSTAKWIPLQAGVPFNRIAIQSSDPEYQAVIQNMNNNGGQAFTSKVITICRIENYKLLSIYKSCRDDMEREHGPGFQNERTLWHGTSADVLGNIYRGGFNRSYCGKHGTAIGDGVYFATAFSYSASPGYSPPDSNGQKYIFQCRVLTGHFTPGKPGLKEPPMRTPELRYDSVVDRTASPSMFVVFKDMQVYPEYVITFKA